MRKIEAAIDIEAPPAVVWRAFTDFASYPEWNPFLRVLEGEPAVGQKLRVRLEPPGQRGITMRPKVQAFEPVHEFRWLGHLGVPGIFDGEHQFTLTPIDQGKNTRFVQRERFRGVLVPFVGSLLRKTEAGFQAMNEALRDRVDATVNTTR